MPQKLVHSTSNLNFYSYAPDRYYVYTANGVLLGDIYRIDYNYVFEPTFDTNPIYATLLDEISSFLKHLEEEYSKQREKDWVACMVALDDPDLPQGHN